MIERNQGVDRDRGETDSIPMPVDALIPAHSDYAEEEALHPTFFRVIERVFGVVLGLLFLMLIFTVGVNVVGRFLFNYSLPWADELSRFVFIWLIFLGAAMAYIRSEHIAVDYLVVKLRSPAARAAAYLIQDLAVLFVLVILLWGGWQVLATSPGRSALLGVPMTWINLSVPAASVLMALMCLYRIGRHIGQISGRKE